MAQELQNLQDAEANLAAQVAAISAVVDALRNQPQGVDPAAVQAVTDKINADAQALADKAVAP